jgi:hypothetical protein
MSDSAVTVKERVGRWLLLIHQIPPKPDYFRVKVRRRLERIGAVALKNSVYVLPHRDQCLEDFRWLLREVVAEGGDATLCEAAVIEGITASEIVALFGTQREAEYADVIAAAQQLDGQGEDASDARLDGELGRLRRRLDEIQAIDYFGTPGRRAAERALTALEARMRRPVNSSGEIERMRGHTWVTRQNVYVDRIASAWLIRRFIDPKARFRFTGNRRYQPRAGELRFDMFDAEYTHEGDRCTFETLMDRAGLRDRALRAIGEIVHDIDCKDGKFDREETPGVAAMIEGLVRVTSDDGKRLERGATLFDQLYASLH